MSCGMICNQLGHFKSNTGVAYTGSLCKLQMHVHQKLSQQAGGECSCQNSPFIDAQHLVITATHHNHSPHIHT